MRSTKSETRNKHEFENTNDLNLKAVIANEVKVDTTRVPRIKCGVLAMTPLFS